MQIWRAANATKENILFWWWAPESLVEEFHDTDASFQRVLMPQPTEACSQVRVSREERCSSDITIRRGAPEGACDQEAHALQKVIAKSLREVTYSYGPAGRSPGYDFIQNMKITDIEINDMIRRWKEINIDAYGNDAREAVCGWVVDNLDMLEDFIPIGYPRVLNDDTSYNLWYLYVAQAMSCFAWFCVSTASYTAFECREKRVFVSAQMYFVQLLLLGFSIISVGALLTAMEPSKGICVSVPWLITLGYSVELLPTLVKTSAMNNAAHSSNRRGPVKINPRRMAILVIVPLSCLLAFLSTWSVIDPPVDKELRVLENEAGEVVSVTTRCDSERAVWNLVSLGWTTLLLLLVSTLAYQSRKTVQEFNESKSLGTMVYSHFLFMIMRIIVHFLTEAESLQPNVSAALLSLNYSFDILFALIIYLIPKVMTAKGAPVHNPRRLSFGMSTLNQRESDRRGETAQAYRASVRKQWEQDHATTSSEMFVDSSRSARLAGLADDGTSKETKVPMAAEHSRHHRRVSSASRGSAFSESDEDDHDRGGPHWSTAQHNAALDKSMREPMRRDSAQFHDVVSPLEDVTVSKQAAEVSSSSEEKKTS
jgi:hypothetical protein